MSCRWGRVFELAQGRHTLSVGDSPDPNTRIAVFAVPPGESEIDVQRRAEGLFLGRPRYLAPGEKLEPGEVLYRLDLSTPGEKRFDVAIPRSGGWAFFTAHDPSELDMALLEPGERGAPSPWEVSPHWTQNP